MKPRGMAAYLPVGRECLGRAASNGSAIAIPEMLPAADLVVAYAVQSDTVLLAEELQRLSSAHRAVATRMKAWGAYVALPLLAGNQVCGVIFLGEKVSGDIYNTNDVSFLRILGKQAAVALDNAQHYQEIVVLNDYHERMLHTMQDGVIAVDPDHRIITFNPAAESITGVPAAEALGNPLALLDLPQLPVTSTGEHPQEIMITTRDGTETPLLVSVTPFTHRGDDVHSLLIVFRDLSALRALEQEKVQAERFSSMGAMAASLAHEIKNPLVPIRTFAHLLPTMYDDPEFREEFGHTVVNEVDRINRLVGQMLDLVRRPAGAREPVDLAEVLHKLLLLVRPQCDAADVALNTRIPETLPPIMGFAEQLYQAILNILMNAVQAMPDGGQLAVEVDVDDAQMICRITDTGPGVPPEALRHIFEPLFTTKEGGHGLGLALTYQFVRAHGGDIRAECAPGSGLIVIVSLPIARQEADLLCT
jgi:PAS domain S-box-containing protein